MIRRLLLRLYPRAWRERYADEMAALLEQHHPAFLTCLALLLGALDAHLSYNPSKGMVRMVDRLKSDVAVRFAAFVVFGLGWLVLIRLNDPVASFAGAAVRYPGIPLLLDALRVAGVIAAIGIAAGGLPLVRTAARHAMKTSHREVLRPLGWALGSAVLFGLASLAMLLTRGGAQVVAAYLILSLVVLAVGTVAVTRLVLKADFAESELRIVRVPTLLVLYGMGGSLAAALALGAFLVAAAPSLLASQDVGPVTYTIAILLIGLGNLLALSGGGRSRSHGSAETPPA